MAKAKRPTWFKMFGHYGALFKAMPSESVGEGMIMAVDYFNTGELPETTDTMAYAVFMTLKPDVDEALSDYEEAVEAGKRGAINKWSNFVK